MQMDSPTKVRVGGQECTALLKEILSTVRSIDKRVAKIETQLQTLKQGGKSSWPDVPDGVNGTEATGDGGVAGRLCFNNEVLYPVFISI